MPRRPINSITAPQSRRSTALRLRRVVAMLLVLGGSDVCGGRFGVGGRAACGAWTPTKNSARGSAGSLCHNAQCYVSDQLPWWLTKARCEDLRRVYEYSYITKRHYPGVYNNMSLDQYMSLDIKSRIQINFSLNFQPDSCSQKDLRSGAHGQGDHIAIFNASRPSDLAVQPNRRRL